MSVKTRIQVLEGKTAGVGHLDIAGLLAAARLRAQGKLEDAEKVARSGKAESHHTDLASRLAAAKAREERLRLEELRKAAEPIKTAAPEPPDPQA